MYRHRILVRVPNLTAWNECLAIADDINKLCAERGWAQMTAWTQTVGPFNELAFVTDYPDLATFQRENDEFFRDPAVREIYRRFDALDIREGSHSELWEEALAAPM